MNTERVHRCSWCLSDPLYIKYHDTEWGVPVHDDRKLFEFIVLEGAQAGLSWLTILKRRDGYREAFCQFNPLEVAKMGHKDVERLMQNENIIRNRAKIEGTIANAKAFLAIQDEFESFAEYSWRFVDGRPKINFWSSIKELPTTDYEAEFMSKDLKDRGFKFVGPTIIYAHMQATGMINDHLVTCFRHPHFKK